LFEFCRDQSGSQLCVVTRHGKLDEVGKWLVSGKIEDMRPMQDDEPLDAPNPFAANGQVQIDAPTVLALQTPS